MKSVYAILMTIFGAIGQASAQGNFDYVLDLQPLAIPSMPGLHSFAFAQHNGKWLLIGGRKDGLHARQPFNAFPISQNNTDIYVIDPQTQQVWSSSVNSLNTGLKEQMQSTNMNFYQDKDTLYIIGGYAFAASVNDHITFSSLTSIAVSSLINHIIAGDPITADFKQLSDTAFAITGGRLGKIGSTFYLVGGHRFDGRYNPMGNPTYTQSYSNQIRKFNIQNNGSGLSISNYSVITDPVHLHRRDYNLLPQVFPNGEEGYTISSGVFQLTADLPYLYPVDVKAGGIAPQTSFNQYLSHYHSAYTALYDSVDNAMHNLFFGGMSEYYYNGTNLIQDTQVPFVKTISRVTRFADGSLQEFQLPQQMPGFLGAGAEFIPNHNLPHYSSEVVKLSQITQDTILVGHIVGGLESPSLNPFSANQTTTTSASPTVLAVRLIRKTPSGVQQINGQNPFDVFIYPNPVTQVIDASFEVNGASTINYLVTTANGQIIMQGEVITEQQGKHHATIHLPANLSAQTLFITFIQDNKYYVTKPVQVN
jgi:hypothetical protein